MKPTLNVAARDRLRGLRVVIAEAFVLEFDEHRLLHDARAVPLPPKAFLTLAVLVSRAGHLVEKGELLDAVWGESNVEEGGLARNISLLRKALGDNPAHHRFIETAATHGYRFVAPVRPLDAGPTTSDPSPLERERARVEAPDLVAIPSRLVEPLADSVESVPEAFEPAPARIPPVAPLVRGRHTMPFRHAAAAAAAALGLVASAAAWPLIRGPASDTSLPDKPALRLVAVMPLVDTSVDAAQHVLAEGLTEGVAAELGKQPGLRVIASINDQLRGTAPSDSRAAGHEPAADLVVAGTLDYDSERIRLDVRVLHSGEDAVLWSRRYERPLGDVIELQRIVAEDVAAVIVPNEEAEPPSRTRPTHSIVPAVYEQYVRARAALDRRTDPDLRAALEAFEEITRIDPAFALAFSGLSQTYMVLMGRGAMSPDEVFPKLEKAARRALTLDPSLGEPHVSLSAVVAVRSGLDAAISELERAVDKQPSLTLARSRLAETLTFQGRYAEAVPQAEEATRLDPGSSVLRSILADVYRQAGETDRAVDVATRLLDQHPDTYVSRMTLGRIHLARGRTDEAIREFGLAVDSSGRNAAMLAELGYALARAGQRSEAAAILAELDERHAVRPLNPRVFVLLCWALGYDDRAVESLRGWLASDPSVQLAWHDPHFSTFRSAPAIAARLGPLTTLRAAHEPAGVVP